MSVNGVTPTGRVSALTADTPTPANFTRTAVSASIHDTNDDPESLHESPRPVRFPWLARLSSQLEAAANQRAAFAAAPVLGDIVDKSV
ncbi:MAG: hypothetical protein Q8R33_21325 [Burkholderiales bacterium]|nr:hypothetical protein [Burkholderiales bacterium]